MLSVSVTVIILVAVTSMVSFNGNTVTQVYGKYSNDQAQSLSNDCQAVGDLSGAPNCANNGLQNQADGAIDILTNLQTAYFGIGDRNNINLGSSNGQNSGDTTSIVGGSVGNDNIVDGGNFCSQCNAQDADRDNTNTDSQNNPPPVSVEEGVVSLGRAVEERQQDNQGLNSDSITMEVPFLLPFP